MAAFFNAVHVKVRSFNLKVYLLFTMHFKQRMRAIHSRKLVSKELDVLMRTIYSNFPYLVPFYGSLFREVCSLEI